MIRHPLPAEGEEVERIRYPNQIYNIDNTRDRRAISQILRERVEFPAPLRPTVTALVMQHLEPTYLFNTRARELTEQRRQRRALWALMHFWLLHQATRGTHQPGLLFRGAILETPIF